MSKSALWPRRQCYFRKCKERRSEAPKSHLPKVSRAFWPPRGSPRGPRGPPEGAQGAQNGPTRAPKAALGDTFGRRVDIAKSLFLLHEMVHFGLWRGPGEAQSRPRGAEETLSEVGRATEAEGRRPRGTQRGAKGAPRARKGTRATSDRPSFGALGPVGGPVDMIYQGRRKRGRGKMKGQIGRRDLYSGSNTPRAVGPANLQQFIEKIDFGPPWMRLTLCTSPQTFE